MPVRTYAFTAGCSVTSCARRGVTGIRRPCGPARDADLSALEAELSPGFQCDQLRVLHDLDGRVRPRGLADLDDEPFAGDHLPGLRSAVLGSELGGEKSAGRL